MGLTLLAAPEGELLSIAEAKLHLRIEQEEHDEDDLILALVRAATEYAETYTRRVFLEQKWRLTLDNFPSGMPFSTVDARPIDGMFDTPFRFGLVDSKDLQPKDRIFLPKPNLLSVEVVKYIGVDGVEVTLDPNTAYDVETGTLPGSVTLKYQQQWPLTRNQRNCVTLDFTAGYGKAASEVPVAIIQAIKLTIGHFYQNREAVVLSRYTIAEVPLTVEALLNTQRVVEYV
jgi:uncharacterized phiE125 gp8 family phage protein